MLFSFTPGVAVAVVVVDAPVGVDGDGTVPIEQAHPRCTICHPFPRPSTSSSPG